MKITNIYKKTAALFFLMAAALWPAVDALGQVVGNKYDETYAGETITHKAAKWFDLRSGISDAAKAMDTFDDETKMFTLQDSTTQVQAAHTYLDTIYVHKGTSVSLEIPDKLKDQPRVESYQRWHSFRTDGTFHTQNTEDDEVWDLLTPSDANTYYRYANGYVGKPKGANLYKVNFYVPTDEEFEKWFSDDVVQPDNKYYLVACDVSSYTDYTKNFDRESSSKSSFNPQSDGNTYEPTLTHRVLFYIVTVDGRDADPTVTWTKGMGRLKDPAYQGGTLDEGKKYLEEYDISFPFTRVSNNTKELVALSKDAWSYAIPGVPKGEDNNTLNISLQDDGSDITLATIQLTGMNRIIQFNYPNTNNTDKTQYVKANNSKATIYVTKTVGGTTYNIARFNLTFVRDTRLLTQTQLEQIEKETIADENLKYYQFRTNKYLEENYELLTSLNFDYDLAVADTYGSSSFYPFPLSWTYNSYSFYDGAVGNDFKNSNKYPEWGYYSIMNDFMEGDHWVNGTKNEYAKPLPGSTYHLYVDASDRPGVIARLPFRDKLCRGTELFVTAWLKSAGWSNNMADANMLFSIMGVRTDPVLGTVYDPIYRHSSSQVRRTDYLSKMPGTGSNTNEWMQMYFSFIIDEDADYESYVLQIDNNSASTDGGDMYIDDIRVYMATPRATVTQREATCTTKRTLLNIKMDWDRLLSRRGQAELTGDASGWDAIDFCFVDSLAYEEAIKNSLSESAAIEASVVNVWGSEDASDAVKCASLYFNLNFAENKKYDPNAPSNLVTSNQVTYSYTNNSGSVETGTGNGFYVYEDESGQKYLSVDFYSDLTPNRPYLMLISPKGIDGREPTVSDFEDIIDDPCGIMTKFWVTSQNIIKINGQIVTPELEYCVGTNLEFTVDLRIPDEDNPGEYTDYNGSEDVYFDWFFGTEEKFLDNTNIYGVSLQEALANFREVYPDAEAVDETETPVNGTFTESMFKFLQEYTTKLEQEHLNPVLTLRKKTLNITLLQDGLNLVVAPIPVTIDDATSTTLERICWGYTPLTLRTSDKSPKLQPGFNALKYPDEEFNPNLRIGLKQIEEVSGNDSSKKGLTVVLRNAKYATTEPGVVDHLGPIINQSFLYLIGTDDQAYTDDIAAATSSYDLPVGWINSLYAKEYGTSSAYKDSIQIRFDLEGTLVENENSDFSFKPKEGYYYTFMIPFEEKGDDGNKAGSACPGMFTLTMKVVPEYLVWNDSQQKDPGETIGNWNNDVN